ncbi:family 43 glycosylhydrolase [Pseudobutyrivibrio sp. LB2011]|uniref:family 43 glycosylhydrolase n=1 Tax=Pseudobutyrivibrio sp. LB2011 TaxID=1408312 RepID=UPI0006797315|nr:family 43 glycosylhydrolase [Pseudobutyrivibrio sp. LB2011]
MKKKAMVAVLIATTAASLVGCGSPKEVVLEKEDGGNPLVSSNEDYVYGGDPSVLVDGDTVYLYTGHDASTDEEVGKSIYNIPEYLCYSSTDMVNWTSEGVVMSMEDVSWTSNDTSAWASQVMKHTDPADGKDKYYLYYCSWDKTGKQCIGVAVSDSPTGTFVDIGAPLVKSTVTKPNTSTFNDIDPTAWIETDEDGVEHRYLAWGNGMFFVCELNEDMTSVTDVNGDGKITSGKVAGEDDVVIRTDGLESYTEAPWIYRRSDENGNYYGDYYLFFAHQWRECMAYATTDNLLSGDWSETKKIMNPTATSNTNHMAVFDFKGKTYFVYHNGSLPAGSGFRRTACVVELQFNDDGSIDLFEESAAGISGKTSTISTMDEVLIAHNPFVCSSADSDYPYKDVAIGINLVEGDSKDFDWVIRSGKADFTNESYVSIESENKPGLYITANSDGTVTLCQDTKASEGTAANQTFKTVEGLADKSGVSLESVAQPGKYVTLVDDVLTLTDGSDKESATFKIKVAQ